MNMSQLITKTLEVINEDEDTAMRRTLETLRNLPEPTDPIDESLRLLIVDYAVAKYLNGIRTNN